MWMGVGKHWHAGMADGGQKGVSGAAVDESASWRAGNWRESCRTQLYLDSIFADSEAGVP